MITQVGPGPADPNAMEIQQVQRAAALAQAGASRRTADAFAAALAAVEVDPAMTPPAQAADAASQVRTAIERWIPRPAGLDAPTASPVAGAVDLADLAGAPTGTGKRGAEGVLPPGTAVPAGTPLSAIEEGATVVRPNPPGDPYATAAPQDDVFVQLVAPVVMRVPSPGTSQTMADALLAAFVRHGGFFDNTGRVDAPNHITKTQPWAWQVLPRPTDG